MLIASLKSLRWGARRDLSRNNPGCGLRHPAIRDHHSDVHSTSDDIQLPNMCPNEVDAK